MSTLLERLPHAVLAVVSAALLAVPVAGQAQDFAARVPPEALAVVAPVLEAAAADGLPVEALRAKVLEGVAKGVPAARIGQVVEGLAAEFRAVRDDLRMALPSATLNHAELVAAAMASRQGVGVDAIASIFESRPDATTLEVPLTVLGELVRRGVPVPEAASVMGHVVREGVPMSVAAQIPGKLDGVRGNGQPPGVALGQALRMLDIPDPPGRGKGRGPGG